MPHADTVVLFVAALIGQALNTVAGGGSFITFPMLLVAGVAPIEANATSTIALWPGALASAWGYRRDVTADGRTVVVLAIASIVGGLAGALLLLWTPEQRFRVLIPYLLLFATVLFAVSDRLPARWTAHADAAATSKRLVPAAALQLAVAVYGGYFGGGIGIMMLAAFTLMDLGDIHSMNGLKVLLNAVINSAAVATFVVARLVAWPYAVPMIIASIISGYATARIARRIEPRVVRQVVVVVGALLTVYFFVHR